MDVDRFKGQYSYFVCIFFFSGTIHRTVWIQLVCTVESH
jgi:hypothetical protein